MNPLQDAGVSPHIIALLNRLHKLSLDQEANLEITALPHDALHAAARDAFIALDQEKCHFVYQLARATNAKTIVEAGTSFGVSTIYLSLAANANVESSGGQCTVIATEHEPSKAAQARKYWDEVGNSITSNIDLRIGDLLQTLKEDVPQVDLVLIDIWAPMTLPTLKLLQPRLRHGTVIIIDNTISSASRYKDLLQYLRADGSGFLNLTVPYSKGLEMCIYSP